MPYLYTVCTSRYWHPIGKATKSFRDGSSLRNTTALRPFQSCQQQRRTKVSNNLGEVWGPCRLGRTFCSSESILTPRNEAVHFTSFPTDENNFNIWPNKVQRENEVMFLLRIFRPYMLLVPSIAPLSTLGS